jgi:hypothetical protein
MTSLTLVLGAEWYAEFGSKSRVSLDISSAPQVHAFDGELVESRCRWDAASAVA